MATSPEIPRIFFSAGEASGDAYAGALLTAFRGAFAGTFSAEGVGGRHFLAQGGTLVADSSTWGAIGIAQALRVYPRVARGFYAAKRALKRGQPGLFVPIDFGYMNIRLARHAKNHGWKVLYFSPPGAWRKDRQGADLPRLADAIVTPFSWSEEILSRMGARAYWYGHPIRELIAQARPESTHSERHGLAILPGSRRAEVDLLLPLFAEALRDTPETIEFAVAASISAPELQRRWQQLCPERSADRFTPGDTYGVLLRAKAALVCSGTATLEAALCGCPQVVVYRVGPLVVLQARLIGFKVDHIAQPNILLGRRVVPELLQDAATPKAVREALAPLLIASEARQAQCDAYRELEALLGPADAISRTAALMVELLGK